MFKIEYDSFTIVSVSSTVISCSSEMIPNQKHFDLWSVRHPTCMVKCCLLLYSYMFESPQGWTLIVVYGLLWYHCSWKQNYFTVASVSSTDVNCSSKMFPSEIHSRDLSFRLPTVVVEVPSRTRDSSLTAAWVL